MNTIQLIACDDSYSENSNFFSLMGQIKNPAFESGFVGRWIISSEGMARSARGFGGIFAPPPICLTRTRPPDFFPMVAEMELRREAESERG